MLRKLLTPARRKKKPTRSSGSWEDRERALMTVVVSYLTPNQAASALDQWEAVLASRPELAMPLQRG